jgi:hypothetical protein
MTSMARDEELQNLLAAEHPGYLFGFTNLLPYLLDEGKVAEARAWSYTLAAFTTPP